MASNKSFRIEMVIYDILEEQYTRIIYSYSAIEELAQLRDDFSNFTLYLEHAIQSGI